MSYKGHRPDLMNRLGRELHEFQSWNGEWHDAKALADALKEDLHQCLECLEALSRQKAVKLRTEDGRVSFQVLSTDGFMMPMRSEESVATKPRKQRKCSKCGKPIRRRHARAGTHPEHECHLEQVRRVMED